MKGSEFAATFGKQSATAWESAAFELERSGENRRPTFLPVPLAHKDGRTAVIDVASDYFAVGDQEDFLRLPLTPGTAQKIANLTGLLLPTPMLVYRIWQASTIKLPRIPIVALKESTNKGPNFAQYVKHNAAVQAQLAGVSGSPLVSGHKKDVVVGNLAKPNTVLIFGWYKPSPDIYDDGSPWQEPDRQPQQAYSNAHGASYVDYSHGIRLVSPLMTIEGKDVETEKVFTDSSLSGFVSREGAIKLPRYPAPFPDGHKPQAVASSFFTRSTSDYAMLGAEVLIANAQKGRS